MQNTPTRRPAESLSRAKVIAKALSLLHGNGIGAVTINGLGRELGVSGPALYRHFANLNEIVDNVVGELYDDVRHAVLGAAAGAPTEERLFLMARRLRTWALDNRQEFQLLFNSPIEPQVWSEHNPAHVAGRRFGVVFLDAFKGLLSIGHVRQDMIPLGAKASLELTQYLAWSEVDISLAELAYFFEAWVQIYGHVIMEALGQLSYALSDMSALLEGCLRGIANDLGVDYRPPAD